MKKVILSGFGTEDTHHLLHTLRWGHDGNLYMNQAVYIHSHIETPYGVRRLNAGGVWQFRPETRRLEVFTRGMWNSWGHHFDRFGQSFQTDGAGGQGIYVAFPGVAYDPAPGAARTLQGLNPGSPKYCGLEIVSGSHLPDDWQGSLITCDFRAHRVVRFSVAPLRPAPAKPPGSCPTSSRRPTPPSAPSTASRGRTARSTSPTGTTPSFSTARSISATRAAT